MFKKIMKIIGCVIVTFIILLGIAYYIIKDRIGLVLSVAEGDKSKVAYYIIERGVKPRKVIPKINLISYYIITNQNNIDYDFLNFMIETGFEINQDGTERIVPLYHAIILGNPELIHFLVKNGADVNFLLDNKFKPLRVSLMLRNCEISKILVDYGATLKDDRNEIDFLERYEQCKKNNWISQQKENNKIKLR